MTARGDAVIPGDLSQAHPAAAVAQDGRAIQRKRPPSDVRAFQAGAPHADADPLDYLRTFLFGDGANDDHDVLAQRTGSIDPFAGAEELEPEPVELVECFSAVPLWR